MQTTPPSNEAPKPISFDVKQAKDKRPADYAIQETDSKNRHVSWTIKPSQDTSVN